MTLQISHRVDARGLACPMPIVKTAQAIAGIASGELLEVLATDPGSTKDFVAWSRTTGHELVEQSVADGVYRFVLRRK
jgi:tRNA 2-thiouridine synthesizing protein A